MNWKFTQQFSLRASTMLLFYISLLVLVALFARDLLNGFAEYIALFVWRSLESGLLIALVAAVLGLSFFVASIFKRNPQVQFAIEFFLGALVFIGWPVF